MNLNLQLYPKMTLGLYYQSTSLSFGESKCEIIEYHQSSQLLARLETEIRGAIKEVRVIVPVTHILNRRFFVIYLVSVLIGKQVFVSCTERGTSKTRTPLVLETIHSPGK